MAGKDAFRVEGVIVEALPNGTYQVALANGHRLVGFVAGRKNAAVVKITAGETVTLQLTPYDLSAGRILIGTKQS